MTLAHRSLCRSLCPSLALAPMILAALALGACASNPNKAKDLDASIEKSEAINDRSSIGVKDGNMIYQKKVLIAEELRNLQIKTHEMESALYGGPRYLDNRGYWGVLKDCREQLSLLEDGKLKWAEKREYVIQDTDKVQMGLDEKGKIAGLTEEFLNDRLVRYREYKAVLEVRTEDMQEKVASCRLELKAKKKEKEKDQD